MQPSHCPGVSVLRLTITVWRGRCDRTLISVHCCVPWRDEHLRCDVIRKPDNRLQDWSYAATTQKTTTDISTAVRTPYLCCVEEVYPLIWSHRSKTLPHTNKREKEQKEDGITEIYKRVTQEERKVGRKDGQNRNTELLFQKEFSYCVQSENMEFKIGYQMRTWHYQHLIIFISCDFPVGDVSGETTPQHAWSFPVITSSKDLISPQEDQDFEITIRAKHLPISEYDNLLYIKGKKRCSLEYAEWGLNAVLASRCACIAQETDSVWQSWFAV